MKKDLVVSTNDAEEVSVISLRSMDSVEYVVLGIDEVRRTVSIVELEAMLTAAKEFIAKEKSPNIPESAFDAMTSEDLPF